MHTVETVRGAVPAEALGRVLAHEHVFVADPEARANLGRDWWDEDAAVAKAVAGLTDLAEAGFGAIMDPTVFGLGRDVRLLARVQEQVPLTIVAATGLYIKAHLPRYLSTQAYGAWHRGDRLAELFIRDLEHGIGDSGIRAAFLKCVVDAAGYTPDQERVHHAVLRAHEATGAPLMVHTDGPSRSAGLLLDEWTQRGVDFTRVIVSHASECEDLDLLIRLLDHGAILGFDKFGLDVFLASETRTRNLLALLKRGHAAQIVLSQDYGCFADTFADDAGTVHIAAEAPDWGYRYVDRILLPALREAGVSESDIDAMLVEAPRRFLTGS